MNLDSLDYLVTVVKQHSFTKAAKSISISQQGLSKSIKHLEDKLGLQLLDRSGKQVALSLAGREMLGEITAVVNSYKKLERKAAVLRRQVAGPSYKLMTYATAFYNIVIYNAMAEELHACGIGASSFLEAEIDTISQSIEQHPERTVAIANLTPASEAELAKAGLVQFDPVFSITTVLAASNKLVSPRIKVLTRKRVKTLPIAYFNEPVFNETVEPFFDYYQPDNVISHTSNMDMLYKSVAAGDVAMITDSLSAYINRGNADIIFFPIDLPLHNNIGFLYSNTIDLSPQQQSFIDSMRQCLWAKWRNYINRNPPR